MDQTLHVGAAECTINPRLGMQIDGNIGAHRPAQLILEDLHARAVAFQQGEKRFLLLSLELLAITEEWTEAIRDFAAEEFGFEREAVAVHVVQNHSSPSMGQIMLSDRLEATGKYPWIRGSDPDYGPFALERIKPMIREAVADLQPVRLLFGSALESRVSFNRRIAMRDGTSEMGLAGRPQDALYREGPSDPEVGVATFTNADLQTTAAFLHHTCHPVHWHPHHAIHSDWPGAWANEARHTLLPTAVPLVLNGCCGNVHHADALNPDREDTPQSMARLLTLAVRTALTNPCFSDDNPVLAYSATQLDVPYRQFPEGMFEDAHALLEAHPEPMWTDDTHTRFEWDWHFAASQIDVEHTLATEEAFEYEIQALRLGGLAILVLPGEPFVEAQLQIKQRSPAARTFVAHMSNQYVGYIPTAEAIQRGGYETRPGNSSKLAPEALQMITDRSVELLEDWGGAGVPFFWAPAVVGAAAGGGAVGGVHGGADAATEGDTEEIAMQIAALAVLALSAAAAPGAESPTAYRSWPEVGRAEQFRLGPMIDQRVGFTLDADSHGRRVVVAVRAFAESKTAGGYNDGILAVDVNGEIMQPLLAGKPRLLNRPEQLAFGPDGKRTTAAWRKGTLGLIESWGSARWTVPWAPSLDAWLASADYKPAGLEDPAWIVIEITDMVHPDSFNYLMVKNESKDATLRCEGVSIHVGPKRPGWQGERQRREAIAAVHRRLEEEYLGRSALVREPSTGREWVYDMDLAQNNYSASDTMGEIETLDDARRIIKPLADQGYNAVMVSGLHMRYTFVPLWETRILPYMRHLCQAAHEAGMKVIHHFDVPIFYSGGYPFLLSDDHLDWTQRDIRYGTPTRIYCLNNPGFREHFFTWIRRLQRESGIDAYQIDEVCFHSKYHCGCEHCRRLFAEETGFELPREPDSPVLNNDADPLWQLWRLWQSVSLQKFKRDFLAETRTENRAALLSTYTTSYYSPAASGGLWPAVFVSYAIGKEGVTRVPFQNYRYGIADRRLYHSLTDAFDSAPWMLWYPLTGSAGRFCWALSQACNDAQWHVKKVSSSVRDLVKWPHETRKFDFRTFADVAMVFSEKSKNASLWTGCYHGMETLGWGEAMVDANIQYQQVHEVAVTPELLAPFKLVILPRMTLIDPPNREAFEAYVRGGGTLLVTAETGLLDEQTRPREDFLLGEMMNLRFVDFLPAPFEVVKHGHPTFTYDRERMLYKHGARMLKVRLRDPVKSRIVATFRKDGQDHPGIVATGYGKGTVYYVATFLGLSNLEMGLQENSKDIFRRNPDSAPFMAALIREILGDDETVTSVDSPGKLIYTTWRKKDGSELNIHFLNVTDHKPLGPDEVAKRRKLNFPLVDRPISLLLRGMDVTGATFYSPDTPAPVPCTVARAGPDSTLTIPAGVMKMYGVAKVQLNGGAR